MKADVGGPMNTSRGPGERAPGGAPPLSRGAAARRGPHTRAYIIVGAIVVAIGLAYLAYWYVHLRGWVATDDAFVDADAIEVAAKIVGRVDSLTVAEGDSVAPGQLLVVLEASELQAQEAQARADVEVARQSITVQEAALKLAQEDYERARVQHDAKIIPDQQFQHAQNAFEMARARVDMARAQLQSAAAKVPVIRSQIEHTRIFSPARGVVARKWVSLGDIVQPATPIFTLYDLHDVWVTANLEETKIGLVHVGDPAQIDLDAYRRTFTGEVSLIGAAAASQFSLIPPNNASGNFTKVTQRIPVRLRFSDAAHSVRPGLLPGMSATVRIRVAGRS